MRPESLSSHGNVRSIWFIMVSLCGYVSRPDGGPHPWLGPTGGRRCRLWIPLHHDLKEVLESVPQRSEKILTSSRGQPWTVEGFKASWQTEMQRPEMAKLKKGRRVFHGLRKSAVVFLLEAGASDAEVAAITGQSRQMVEHYSRAVNQKRLAAAAVLKWENLALEQKAATIKASTDRE
jgi:integrase